MAQDFTSFVHGNTVFHDKIRPLLRHDGDKATRARLRGLFFAG
ncbi:hypothetical protein AXX16_4466 [Serratia rubidaea]|nr:hypothetical protein [Serratia rubidaea]AML60136.1 hypothetical protein AXX16_4466 [Serratia rubidaea]